MGKYVNCKAKAISHDFGVSKQKQTPYVSLIFETVPTNADEPVTHYEWNGWLSEKAFNKTIEQLKLCGATFPDGDIRKLTGYTKNVVSVSIEETDFGPRVAWINAPGSVTEENRLSGSALDALARTMRGALLSGGSNGGARPAAAKVSDPFANMSAPKHHDHAHLDGRGPNGGHADEPPAEERAPDSIPF